MLLPFLNTEFKKGSNIIVNLDANDEVEISLNESGVSEIEDDKSDSPKRRRFALSTIRKRKKLEEEKEEEKEEETT